MMQPFYFGRPDRALAGIHHSTDGLVRKSWLICAPMLQDAIRCQRALWTLAVALAAGDGNVLRFDWYGTGDSDGTSRDLSVPGMLEDLSLATLALGHASPAPIRCLAMRSGALPALAFAASQSKPVDLVLWDPAWNGADLVATWRRQHVEQLQSVGRYANGKAPQSAQDELVGFMLAPEFLAGLATLELRNTRLPAGSRVTLAGWGSDADGEQFLSAQRSAGITTETILLDASDRPAFDDPRMFEAQAFPRRSVAQLAKRLVSGDSA